MKHRLIFVEGVSGVGKTVTVQTLQGQLKAAGYDAVCHIEGDGENPLDPFDGAYPPVMRMDEYCARYIVQWRRFAQGKEKTPLILDGTLLHHPVNDLIRNYDAPRERIAQYLTTLLEEVEHLNPVVFYLECKDVGQRLIQAQHDRRKPTPTREKLNFGSGEKASTCMFWSV